MIHGAKSWKKSTGALPYGCRAHVQQNHERDDLTFTLNLPEEALKTS